MSAEERLAQVRALFDSALRALAERIAAVRAGEGVKLSEAAALTTDLRKWALLVSEEQQKLERSIREAGGTGPDRALDLDAARASIGGRLDRLRAARDPEDIP